MHNERIDPSTTQDVQEQEEQEDFKALVVEMVPVKWSITTKYKRTPVILRLQEAKKYYSSGCILLYKYTTNKAITLGKSKTLN